MDDHRTGARTAVVVVAVLVAALIGGWLVLLRGGSSGPSGRPLFVVGDSVSYLAAGQIQAQFRGDRVEFVTKPGYTSKDLLPLVRKAQATAGTPAAAKDRVAVLVGYNDVRVRDLTGGALPALMDETAAYSCAVWLLLPSRPGGHTARNDFVPSPLVDQLNARIEALAGRHRHVHVASDWKDAVEGAPTAGTYLLPDHVHPNTEGQKRLAEAYGTAVRRFC